MPKHTEHDPLLDQVTTAAEIAREYGIPYITIASACERLSIPARQSGATWLILRADAEARWGKRRASSLPLEGGETGAPATP